MRRTTHDLAFDSVAALARERLHREVLKTLRDFLDRVGEPWWAEWVQIRMEDGRFPEPRRKAPPMTLDDLVLGNDRIDRIPPHLLPWANSVLDCLRCLARRLESRPAGRTGDPGTPDLAPLCAECVGRTAAEGDEEAVPLAVRRSVLRACREGRFDHLLILGRLESDDGPISTDAPPARNSLNP